MLKLDTLISLLRSDLPYIILLGVVTAMVVSRPTKLWQKSKEIVPRNAATRLFSTLQTCRKNGESSSILNRMGTKIPLTLLDYETSSRPLRHLGRLLVDRYCNALILGEPGSGKSTLLQRYALDFMDKELNENDLEKIRLPIFLPLHEWAKKKQPFNVFLLRYLPQVLPEIKRDRRSLLPYWMSQGKFILLLDGLDEMNKEDSKKCIDALNTFSKETTSPIIVSCRLERYETLLKEQSILEVNETAVIQKLKPREIQKYLNQEGATRLSHSLYQENKSQEIKEIAVTPLMAQVLAQTFPDTSDWQLPTLGKDLFQIYTRNAIQNKKAHYSDKYISKMGHWLTLLATYMDERLFFYFRLDNLPDNTSKILYVSSTWLIIVLLGGAASLLAVFGRFQLWQLLPMIAIIAGFYGYLRKSILTGVYMTVLYILALVFPFVASASSSEKTRLQRARDVLTTLAFIFFLPLLLSVVLLICTRTIGIPLWPGFLIAGMAVLLIEWLLLYTFYRIGKLQVLQPFGNNSLVMQTFLEIVYMLIVRHVEPLLPETLSPKISLLPIKDLILRIAEGVALGFIIWLPGYFFWQTNLFLAATLITISIWLDRGLGAGIRGYILRFWFWWFKILPWPAGFLDDAVTCSLLAQQGDCFKFFFETPMQNYFRGQADEKLLDIPDTVETSKEQPAQPSSHEDEDKPLEIFCCYHHEDEKMLDLLKKHLKPFQREDQFTIWSDTNLIGGDQWKEERHKHLENADIILLLISPDFMDSDYCYNAMMRAIQRHDDGRAVALPILLRPTLWKVVPNLPFAHLQIFPKNGKPVSLWPNPDKAFNDIAFQVYQVVLNLLPFYR